MSARIEMFESGKTDFKGDFRSAEVIEWRTASSLGMEALNTKIPYDTVEDREKVDSLKRGDILELTSKEFGWTRKYAIQLFGVEHNQKVKLIYVTKI